MKRNSVVLSLLFAFVLVSALALNASSASAFTVWEDPQYPFVIEAEDMHKDSEFDVRYDPDASGGYFIMGLNYERYECDVTNAPMAWKTVYIYESGYYELEARTIAPNTGADSFCVKVDNGPKQVWGVPNSETWQWNEQGEYYLSAGTHTIRFYLREGHTRLDAIRLASDQPHCSDGWLNSYRCDGDWRQRLYRYSDCDTVWRNWEYCDHGCSNGVCKVARDICAVDAYSLSFRDRIHEGESATITAKAKNTGTIWERVTLYIYFDNALEHVYTDNLRPGEIMTRVITMHPDAGTHYVKVKASAECGASDTASKTLTVYHPSYPHPPYCDYDGICESWESSNCADCDYDPYEPEPVQTTVTFYPSTLDLKLYEGKVITISANSRYSQLFTVDVDGVPSDWLSYTKSATIAGKDKIYVYITPKEPGLYDLDITVRAQGEGRDFRKTVSMYVSEEAKEPEPGMPFTGMATLTDEQVLVGVGVLVIIIIIIVGVILLRRPGVLVKAGFFHSFQPSCCTSFGGRMSGMMKVKMYPSYLSVYHFF